MLIHIVSEAQVVVQFWGQPTPDIRGFLTERRLARPDVHLALVNRKNESVVVLPGSEFMHGDAPKPRFPWEEFEAKWKHRLEHEPDDWQVAPHTCGTLCWEQASSDKAIPWAALKSAWRRDQTRCCPNCGSPLVVLRFLWVLPIMFSGIRRITRGCFWCHREFEESVDKDFWAWLVKALDPDVLPTHHYATRKYDLRSRYPSGQAGLSVEAKG